MERESAFSSRLLTRPVEGIQSTCCILWIKTTERPLTQKGRLFMQTQDHAYDSQDVVRFLRLLLRRISGKLLIISDGATIHRSQVIKDWSFARGSQTHPFKALTWVCARTQPDIWASGICSNGVNGKQCLLSGCATGG
jgi:hypothetical protein